MDTPKASKTAPKAAKAAKKAIVVETILPGEGTFDLSMPPRGKYPWHQLTAAGSFFVLPGVKVVRSFNPPKGCGFRVRQVIKAEPFTVAGVDYPAGLVVVRVDKPVAANNT